MNLGEPINFEIGFFLSHVNERYLLLSWKKSVIPRSGWHIGVAEWCTPHPDNVFIWHKLYETDLRQTENNSQDGLQKLLQYVRGNPTAIEQYSATVRRDDLLQQQGGRKQLA